MLCPLGKCEPMQQRRCWMMSVKMKCQRTLFIFFYSLDFHLLGQTCLFARVDLFFLLYRLVFLFSILFGTSSMLFGTYSMFDLSWLFLLHRKVVLVDDHLLTCTSIRAYNFNGHRPTLRSPRQFLETMPIQHWARLIYTTKG